MDVPTSGAPPAGGGTYFLGRYRVVDEIGIGGMASVHLARMDGPGGFQKWVAIKRIHAHLIEDDSFVHMFLDEARVAARISHPNVANVFDLGKDNDSYWIAMEYLHGEPLREVMRRTEEMGQPMPPEIACRVIADAAEGLHAAHELLGKNGEKLQLVHRDVTPHNLFVTYDGTTKVVDFGIAKFSSRTSNTRAGTLKGKLAYMSPEQVHGEGIDRRTDIFALGVVLWELTTGQRLFRMESDLDTLAKVQECNVPRPSTLIRGYPIDLEKIVMKALAKNRGERFRTARELSRALQSLLMRRGLFIASDEVAAYVQVIFQDRIQKREAHLRWAADVTQTINLEGLLAKQAAAVPEPSIQSFNSDVQNARAAPRPAAGQPANVPIALPTHTGKQQVPIGPSGNPTANQLASTVGAPAAGGVPRPSSIPPRPIRERDSFRPGPPPAPTSGRAPSVAPPLQGGLPRQARVQIDAQEGVDDGPTIQAPAHLSNALYPGASGSVPTIGSALGPGGIPSPGSAPRLDNRGPLPPARPSQPVRDLPQHAPGYEDEPEDATLVTAARYDEPPIPAAGRPAPARQLSQPQLQPQGLAQPRAQVGPGPAGLNSGLPPVGMAPRRSDPRLEAQRLVDSQNPPTMAGPPNAPWMQQQGQHGQPGAPPGYPSNQYGPPPGMQPGMNAGPTMPPGQPFPSDPFGLGAGNSGQYAAVQGPPTMAMQQGAEVFRYAPPGNPLESTTLQPSKKKPNLVLLGIVCGLGAIFFFTFIGYLFMSRSSGPVAGTGTGGATPDPSTTSASGTSGPNGSAVTENGGPFSVVRAGFREVSVAPPAASSAPSGMAGASGNGAVAAGDNAVDAGGAEPVAVAANDAPPPVAAAPDPTPDPPTARVPAAPPHQVPVDHSPAPAAATHRATPSVGKGFLTVICSPGCDQIIDNGRPLGTAPIFRREVPAGEHHLRLMNGSVAKTVSVIIVAEDLKIIKQSMTP
jgi:serine/threonine protein kinase